MTVLILGETGANGISPSLRNAVTAARQLSGNIHVLVAGFSIEKAVQEAATIAGVEKVLHAEHALFEHALPENLASFVATLTGYSHIVAIASNYGKDVLPRLAGMLNIQQVSEVSRIVSPDTYQHPIYAGNILETVQSLDTVKLLTLRATAFDPAPLGGNAVIEKLDVAVAVSSSEWLNDETTKSARPDLASARIVVSGGRGLGSKENFRLLETIADKLNAALGASRAAVDAGYVPNDYQVGQTGKTVAPELYLAVGISGAIQHLAGMKDSKVIVAINKDENAPIFEIADYGLVGDLFDVLPKLAALL